MHIRAIAFLFVCFFCSYSFAYTIIFKSGKQLQGTLILEEENTIRFTDHTGVYMSLKKASLDLNEMRRLNIDPVVANEPVPKPESSDNSSDPATTAYSSSRVFTNADVTKARQVSSFVVKPGMNLQKELRAAEREYAQLANRCRNAGAVRPNSRYIRTDTYVVNGKTVRVTGNWADPGEIDRARRVCEQAQATELRIQQIRDALNIQQHSSAARR